jgi:hypothetical protein
MKSATPTAKRPAKLSVAGALNAVALEAVCLVVPALAVVLAALPPVLLVLLLGSGLLVVPLVPSVAPVPGARLAVAFMAISW